MNLPHDPALPQLATALDEAAMCEAFAAARPDAGIVACRVDRIKYRPQRNASISYRLDLHDGGQQIVAARLCSSDDALRRARRDGPASGALHLPALDMVAWFWPADAKLRAPRVLADPALLCEQVLPALLPPGARLLAFRVDVVQYVPESRLCARVHLHSAAGEQVLYAKSSREPAGDEAHRILQALHGRAGLRVPRPLCWQSAFELHWQQAVPGRALLDLLPEQQAALAPELGAQLAALHGTPVAITRELTPAVLLERLRDVHDVLHAALPAARDTLRALVARLAAGVDTWAGAHLATLHGDLHPRNVLADGEALSLIDLDGLRRGPAVLELGSWRADAIYRAVLEGRDPAHDEAAWQALLAGYAAAGGTRPRAGALAWACAWNLLTQRAWRCVVNLKPGRFAIAPRLVALAADMAAAPLQEAA